MDQCWFYYQHSLKVVSRMLILIEDGWLVYWPRRGLRAKTRFMVALGSFVPHIQYSACFRHLVWPLLIMPLSHLIVAYCVSNLAGKEKNFVYSHLHPQIRVYEANPKPVGLAFGGTVGNERIFLDEDFSKVVVRHHAVDKTYQHGSLIPNQVKFRLTAPHWRYQLDCLLYIVYTAPRYFLSPYL